MKKIIAILTIGLLMTACVNEDANTDPNSAYSTVPGSLITYAQKELSDYVNTPSVNENNFRLTMQYWQETTYVNESNYDFTNRNVSNNIYTDNYVNVLNNLGKAKEIINAYEPTPTELAAWPANKKTQLAIIDVMQVYTFQLLVDTFGNIPYTQAANLVAYPLPAYDDAATIYSDLITRINADVTALSSGTANSFPTFKDGDKIFGGDPASWRIFANSLKLKLALGIADANPSLAQSTATSAIAAGVMTSSANNGQFPYLDPSPNYNPLYENLEASGREDFVGGKTLVDYMNTSNDPRIDDYYTSVKGVFVGLPIGEGGEFADFSHAGEYAYTTTTPGNILTYTEVAFYVAEANARWNPAAAPAAYDAAVTASILEWGGTEAEATAYLATKPYDPTNWKKSIGEQAWVAMYNQALTSWNFWRRLDFPVLLAPPSAINNAGGKVPVRMTYPVLEQQTNNTNWKAASDAIGGDLLTTKLFWDKN